MYVQSELLQELVNVLDTKPDFHSAKFWLAVFQVKSIGAFTLLLKIPKTDEKIAMTSTVDFSYWNAIKVRWENRQKNFPISFEDTANFSYLPNTILPPY